VNRVLWDGGIAILAAVSCLATISRESIIIDLLGNND